MTHQENANDHVSVRLKLFFITKIMLVLSGENIEMKL